MIIKNDEKIYNDDDMIIWFDNNKNINYDHKKVKDIEVCQTQNFYTNNEKGSFFIFTNYKTFKYYSRQIIEVDTQMKKILDKYITVRKLKNGDKLFNLTRQNYTLKLKDIMMRYSGKIISTNLLRHIYITHMIYHNKISDNEKKILSHRMAHSIKVQNYYRKKTDENNYNIVNVINQKASDIENKCKNKDTKYSHITPEFSDSEDNDDNQSNVYNMHHVEEKGENNKTVNDKKNDRKCLYDTPDFTDSDCM